MKKILKTLILPLLVCSLGSCGGGGGDSSSQGGSSSSETIKYTVSFESNGGTAVASVTVSAGSTLSEPTAPTKEGYIFTYWYLDSALSNKASFPLSISKDTTLYAGWLDCRDYYLAARDKTVGTDSKGFEYSSALDVTVGYSSLSYSAKGNYTGLSQYSPSADDSYYEKIIYTGLLFDDHTTHEYLKGDSLVKINVNEDSEVTSYSSEAQEAGYRYDSSSFAKALFSYSKDDIKQITLVSGSKYEIKAKAGFSSIAKTVLNNVNNKYVEMIIGSLPETESSYHNYVSFSKDGTIDTYSYSFTVTVSGVVISLSYSLDFSLADEAPTISLPTFSGLSTSTAEIESKLTAIKTILTSYRAQATSAYDFTLKTGINFASANDINATVKGKALRAVSGGTVYFNNKIELDSDLKNSDLYKAKGVVDYTRTRGKISDGTVYDVEDPLLGSKKYTEVTSSTASDEFYLLIGNDLLTSAGFSCVFDKTKEGVETLTLPVLKTRVADLLTFVNGSVRLDPTLATNYNVLGEFDATSIESNDATIEIDLTDSKLAEVRINLEGKMMTSYMDTETFATSAEASYSVELTLTMSEDATSYTVPTVKGDIVQ